MIILSGKERFNGESSEKTVGQKFICEFRHQLRPSVGFECTRRQDVEFARLQTSPICLVVPLRLGREAIQQQQQQQQW